MKNRAYILKIALFATGLSGIVAEYVLATLASYFLGDSVVQWTMIVSIMLFSMGVGSRITKYINKNIFVLFISIEFALSLIVSFSAVFAYSIPAVTNLTGMYIYILSILTGLFIGMELPLAVRLNDKFEELKINISTILEKDYYGSLVGGVFFAFIGLPYLGLTYTPFILGAINLLVAFLLLNYFPEIIQKRSKFKLNILGSIVVVIIVLGLVNTEKIIFHSDQRNYKDKIIYSEQSRYQKIVITQWKENYWLYLNNNLQFCSYDEALYHEVLVHPAMRLCKTPYNILILGGGDGCAARELLKYEEVKQITIVDLDPAITRLAAESEILVSLNQNSLNNRKVTVLNEDGYTFIQKDTSFYDLIVIDLPDPRNIDLSRLYSLEFYALCYKHVRPNGIIITQAGSPYYASRSFKCINKTIVAAGFSTIPLHNQIITMGEWGWILGVKNDVSRDQIKIQLLKADFSKIDTKWLNNEAMYQITSFGKDFFDREQDTIKINKINQPVLYRYYLDGSWDIY